MRTATEKQLRLTRALLVLGAAVIAACAFLAGSGWSYYLLPIHERPFHPEHSVLRPSGTWGLTFGLVGTLFMILNLGYLVRKRLVSVGWLGSLRSWMGFHLFTGLVGPALIVLHTAFQPSSALGTLAFAAMLIAVATGVVGRYVYAHMPRSIEGRELELGEAKKRLDVYRLGLERLGVRLPTTTLAVAAQSGQTMEVWSAFRALFQAERAARQEFAQFRKDVLANAELRARAPAILPVARALCRERQRIARYLELKFLMSSWRFFHRWLAIVMLLVVLFHVTLALVYGDLWILGGRRS